MIAQSVLGCHWNTHYPAFKRLRMLRVARSFGLCFRAQESAL